VSSRFARRFQVGATSLVLVAAIAACSDDSSGTKEPTPRPSRSGSPTSSATATDTGSGAPSTSPSSSPTSSGPTAADPSLVADLLSAQRMPGLNSETTWAESATYPNEGPDFTTVCQLHPWKSIGSTAVVRRDYAGPAESTAISLVAEFATGRNARRATAVWIAWAHECEATAAAADHKHPHINDVPYHVRTVVGEGRWWLLTYGPVAGDPQASYLQAFGLVRSNDRLALVRMTSVGQDYSYEPGQEPVAVALRRTARLLAS
jgi:hypothetical protein